MVFAFLLIEIFLVAADMTDFALFLKEHSNEKLNPNEGNILCGRKGQQIHFCFDNPDVHVHKCPYCDRAWSDPSALIDHILFTRRTKFLYILKNPDIDLQPDVKIHNEPADGGIRELG